MIHVLSLSYGKDSIACLYALREMGWPLERIIHAEIWATEYIPADLPEMVAFKEYADKRIKNEFGIEVEHVYAKDKNGEKLTYEKIFYKAINRKLKNGKKTKYHRVAFSGYAMVQFTIKTASIKIRCVKVCLLFGYCV